MCTYTRVILRRAWIEASCWPELHPPVDHLARKTTKTVWRCGRDLAEGRRARGDRYRFRSSHWSRWSRWFRSPFALPSPISRAGSDEERRAQKRRRTKSGRCRHGRFAVTPLHHSSVASATPAHKRIRSFEKSCCRCCRCCCGEVRIGLDDPSQAPCPLSSASPSPPPAPSPWSGRGIR